MYIHRVKSGETIYGIAGEYGISPIKLAADNELADGGRLAVGRELLILRPTRSYTVRMGDTLGTISKRFGIPKEELLLKNPELREEGRLYQGQPITLRCGEPTFGIGVGNGYLYSGCSRERLMRAFPFLSFLTVACCVGDSGRIRKIFDGADALEEAKRRGKTPLLRIYVPSTDKADLSEYVDAGSILAKTEGYAGITLSNVGSYTRDEVLEGRRTMMERDLLFYGEGELTSPGETNELIDGIVLNYDKVHMESIPSFMEGEEAAMRSYCERCECGGAFLELSAFSRIGDKLVEKLRGSALADRMGATLEYDRDRLLLGGELGRGKKSRRLTAESLENTKAKLRLISELGFMGIAFDIMRTPLCELEMFSSLFSRPSTVYGGTVCNPVNYQ